MGGRAQRRLDTSLRPKNLNTAPRRIWLARTHVGIAHGFVLGDSASICGNVRKEPGLPWEVAGRDKRRCSQCVRAIERLRDGLPTARKAGVA